MKKYEKFSVLMVFLFSLIFGTFILFVSVSSRLDDISNIVIEEINLSQINDGVYFGESNASPVYIDINITVENHLITEITVNYQNIFINNEDVDILIEMIYENQSITFDYGELDQYTSIALFNAIYNALN